ncbi:MAG: hypothetical protein V4706_14685 [Pseudomonadota bacterium]
MKNFLQYLASRLREPSTLAGLSVLGVLVGLPPGTVDIIGTCVAGVAGAAAVLLPDVKPE